MQIRYPAIKISRKNGEHDAGNDHAVANAGAVRSPYSEKNKMQSVIDAMMDSLTMINGDFEIVFQNQRARTSRGEHVGEKCYHAYSHNEKVCEGCPVALAFQGGQPHTVEKKRLEPSGLTTSWEITASPVKDASGKVIICLEIDHEITHRKQAEKALQESQKFVSSLLENAPHATIVYNPDTSVRYVNPAWERLNGWTLAEVTGLKAPYYPWWPKEYQTKEFLPIFVEAIHQPVGRGEILAAKKNGETYWVDMNWVSVTQDGEFQYVIINSMDITERKKAEERRQAILQTAIDGFWICDLKSKFLEVNDAYCAMTGYTREELMKMSIGDIEAIERPEETSGRIKKIIEQGSDRFESRHKCKDGRIIDIEVSVKYQNIGEGQLTVFVRDITGRKRAQKALRESEEKFSKAFHVSPAMVAITALKDGKYIEVNDSYVQSTGFTREELLGHTATDLDIWTRPDDRVRILNALQEQGRVQDMEINFRMKSGKIRTWLFSAEPIDVGGVPCLIGVSVDITERKTMEESLANEAIRRRILIEQSRDGIVVLDQDGKVYEANRRFAEMLGYSQEEVMRLNVWDWEYLYPPEQVLEMIRTVNEAGDHFETQHRRKDGSVYNVEISTNGATFAGQKLIFCVCRDITERKQAEEKRQAILKTALDGFCSTGLDGKFLEVNDSYCAMTGYTREELLGMSITDIDVTTSPEYLAKLVKDVVEQGYARLETKHRCKDGRLIDIEISSKYSNTGETQVYSFVRDITERKKAEEQLRLLSSVTRQTSDSIMITDSKFRITYMNQATEGLFGYSFDEIKGKDLATFHTAAPDEKTTQAVRDTIHQGKVWNQIIPKKRKDGSVIVCDCRLSPLYDEAGHIRSYIEVQRDVTAQKEVEAKVQAQNQLIESILSNMLEGMLVIGGDDRVILANESAHRIFHRVKNAMKNRLLKDVIPVEALLKLYNDVKLSKRKNHILEFRHKLHGIDTIISCGAVRMDGERTLLTFTDVSREREEEEKLYLTDRLASIGEMAAGLVHELNNPLTGILALSQMLMHSNLSSEHKEDLECINTEAKRAAGIVKNVLLFARNKTGENSQCSVNEVVKEILKLREFEERISNITIVTNLEENLPSIPVDQWQLQQVFLNLFSNAEAAIKEVDRPGIINIATQRVNNHINIVFSDNGCGIKKQIMTRIFDPFFTTKEIGKGTGLGLSICYSIIVKHGGTISVKSQVNEGTTFTIRMPIVQ